MTSTSPVGSTLKTCSLSLFDADALSDAVRSSQIEHSQLERGDFKAELKRTDLGRLTLDSGCYDEIGKHWFGQFGDVIKVD